MPRYRQLFYYCFLFCSIFKNGLNLYLHSHQIKSPIISVAVTMHCVQSLLQVNGSPLPLLDPEVLQVHAPPFVSKESLSEPAQRNFSQTQQQCFFIKKNNDRPDIKAGNPKEETTENVSVPKDLDLVALPQLCFPGETRLNAKA